MLELDSKAYNSSDDVKTVYCINCDKKQPYMQKAKTEDVTIRGVTFSYLEHTAYCTECGNQVYVAELNDMNVQSREDAYRKA